MITENSEFLVEPAGIYLILNLITLIYMEGNQEGRPTKYETRFNRQAERLAKVGMTDEEMAEFFEVATSTFYLWKKEHSKFSEAIKKGKAVADANVAESLYRRATGYSHPDVDIRVINDKIEITKLTKYYPPDTPAAIFWLKNRQKDKWRDKIEQGFTDPDGNAMNPVQIFQLPDNGRDRIETKAAKDE